ncbi:hypothetical protein [Desulfosporosinus shakirovi]|uniref:hypothetical protein n=1 Tax=Desulfosporosinus shakirovi TaxID=2885154 RepID=UPI001E29BC58|nr:hypothetical protein [Desulfosporosinus sp. SRJS8]MCB8818830.1 hypothetical protein [Desulfosporosinus sp. SRJS8]
MKKTIEILMLSFLMLTGILGSNVYAGPHTGATSNVGATAWNAQATINTPFYPITYWPSWSCNYTMIQNGFPNTWVQVGWSKENDNFYGQTLNGTYYFFQYNDPSLTQPYTVFSAVGPAVGSSHTYNTLLDETNTYYGTVDNTTIASYPAGFWGSITEYSGEVSNVDLARFAGSTSNGLYMWNIYSSYKNGNTKVWTLNPVLNWAEQSSVGVLYKGSYIVGNPNASFNYWDTRN